MIQVSQNNKSTLNFQMASLETIFNRKVLGIILIVSSVLILTSFMSQTVLAEKSETREKTVVSVLIEPGDTLWSIAKTYYSEEYKSIPNFIDEIKKSNRLYTEDIHAGNYIIVPHYVDVMDSN